MYFYPDGTIAERPSRSTLWTNVYAYMRDRWFYIDARSSMHIMDDEDEVPAAVKMAALLLS